MLACEVKCRAANLESIRATIHRYALKSERHGHAKKNFVIDLQDRYLDDELREGLRVYNLNGKDGFIERLFVVDADGIHEIPLHT